MQWSKYFQNPTFMEMTRKVLLSDDLRPLLLHYCRLKPGDRVLDVGCGTGAFSRYLAEGELDLFLTGIDLDPAFIDYARKKELCRQDTDLTPRLTYICGDASNLPFEDQSFDMVVSHTFLTSVTDPETAVREMMRVVKPGGTIASITAMSFYSQTWHKGYYPKTCTWYEELGGLEKKVWKMYERIDPMFSYAKGKPTSEIPHFFSEMGLEQVSLYPIGKAFSLSNAAMPRLEKEEYIAGMYEAEKEKLMNFLDLPQSREELSETEIQRYLDLILERRNWLLDHVEDNRIWDWNGGANVLITGIVPSMKQEMQEEQEARIS